MYIMFKLTIQLFAHECINFIFYVKPNLKFHFRNLKNLLRSKSFQLIKVELISMILSYLFLIMSSVGG